MVDDHIKKFLSDNFRPGNCLEIIRNVDCTGRCGKALKFSCHYFDMFLSRKMTIYMELQKTETPTSNETKKTDHS